jgi:threonine/homoserine/homoserine lactone efflux protein
MFLSVKGICREITPMDRLAFAVLITLGVTFTVYFGVSAWRASGSTEVTGAIAPSHR